MKKSIRSPRLALTGEIVRRLSSGELAGVAGGLGGNTFVYSCACPTLNGCPSGTHPID